MYLKNISCPFLYTYNIYKLLYIPWIAAYNLSLYQNQTYLISIQFRSINLKNYIIILSLFLSFSYNLSSAWNFFMYGSVTAVNVQIDRQNLCINHNINTVNIRIKENNK